MALYSAKEAKWYRRNVERREHRQFNSPPSPCFIKFPCLRFRCRIFVTIVLFYGRIAKPIAKFESSNSFLFTAPLIRDLPSIDPQPKVRFNYITCYSCQATRGYKTYEPGLCLTGAITSTKSITRHDRAFDKSSRIRSQVL